MCGLTDADVHENRRCQQLCDDVLERETIWELKPLHVLDSVRLEYLVDWHYGEMDMQARKHMLLCPRARSMQLKRVGKVGKSA